MQPSQGSERAALPGKARKLAALSTSVLLQSLRGGNQTLLQRDVTFSAGLSMMLNLRQFQTAARSLTSLAKEITTKTRCG